ncbi:nicotinate-nucleotide--dimethylbenzimidazole phosphoribosyltransferase [Azotosporobacter soli]|uniref:nicotinate-nucleotide--dimethylbenzimidazole phosphoribosyltransferase n=1 Tax=Azotosporobacter soli TaxID=3055040 RepID=UPI0031FED400
MKILEEALARIVAPDEAIKECVREKLAQAIRAPERLGRLGAMLEQYAAVTGSAAPQAPKNCMVIASADHGVAKRGISAYPIETTMGMTENYLVSKGASANAFANFCGADMVVMDMGVAGDLSHVPGLLQRKIAYGTQDFSEGAAMTKEQAVQALESGIALVNEQAAKGYRCFSLGEMGIGNTTCSATIVAAFLALAPEIVTGRGTGISDSRLQVKMELVRRALMVNNPDPTDGLDVLAKVGGFEIGALAGVVLGCAANRCAVVLDGLNTTAAALIAQAIHPLAKEYMFASHLSGEPAHRIALRHLGLDACVDMGVRLGEAIGASIVMDMIKLSVSLLEKAPLSSLPEENETQRSKRSLAERIAQIEALDEAAMQACQLRLDNLTKPLASLHHFEHIALQLAGVTAQPRPRNLKKSVVLLCEADSVEEDVVIARRFAQHAGAELIVAAAKEQSLASQETIAALHAGIDLAESLADNGQRIIGLGALTKDYRTAEEVIAHSKSETSDALTLLYEHAGGQIAALVGVIIGAAASRSVVIIDDLVTAAAALLALKLAPQSKAYLMASHLSPHGAHGEALMQLGLPAYLKLDLRFQGGCGAALGMALLDASLHMLNDMKTFGDAQVAVAEDGPGALKQNLAVKENS